MASFAFKFYSTSFFYLMHNFDIFRALNHFSILYCHLPMLVVVLAFALGRVHGAALQDLQRQHLTMDTQLLGQPIN